MLRVVPIAVLLADDHDLIRRSIKSLLETNPEIRVVAEASNFTEAVQRTAEVKPDVIVLDLHMGINEFDASEIRAAFAGRRLIAITAWNDEESGVLAETYGAATLLDKLSLAHALIPAIKGQERID
jgi:DNA-binding NarL/FixJ family response regulator